MKEKKFNQMEYKNNWRKEHTKQFTAELKIDEYEELTELLNKNNLTKVSFVRKAMKLLNEDSTKFIDE